MAMSHLSSVMGESSKIVPVFAENCRFSCRLVHCCRPSPRVRGETKRHWDSRYKDEGCRTVFTTSHRSVTVLVVDDDQMVRQFVAATLRRCGFNVIEAGSGQEGLKHFAENQNVHLVLSDILMPTMSGPEMVQRILRIEPSVKIMFMTG